MRVSSYLNRKENKEEKKSVGFTQKGFLFFNSEKIRDRRFMV